MIPNKIKIPYNQEIFCDLHIVVSLFLEHRYEKNKCGVSLLQNAEKKNHIFVIKLSIEICANKFINCEVESKYKFKNSSSYFKTTKKNEINTGFQ